jgi:hypothetical protein
MGNLDWEDALEVVVAFLDDPPAADTDEGRRFDEALFRLLAAAPSRGHDAVSDGEPAPRLDAGLRARLDDLARRRAESNPFGDHPDGIGPTLGMDLRKS